MRTNGSGTKWSLRVAAMLVAMVLAACGSSPTSTEEAAGSGGASEAGAGAGARETDPKAAESLANVYAEVEGLEGEERRNKLLELAEAEGGELSFYTTFALEEAEPVIEQFEDETDISVNVYRAPSSSFLQRVLQEADANYFGSDVVSSNGTEMVILEDEGLLAKLETPLDDDTPESYAQSEFWTVNYLNVFTPAWNTDAVSADEAPTTWEEALAAESLSMEITDSAWFMELVTYFQEEKGMTEEEAIALFEDASEGAVMVDGHSVQNELLAGGEFDVAAATYMHRSQQFVRDGAPVAWEPAVEPMIASPNGIGIHINAQRPATALLFIEFMITDSQQLMGELGRTPADADAPGGTGDYEVIVLDTRKYGDEREKWDTQYESIVGPADEE